MAWNFRRRIKVAPGVHVNISKGGISTTVGGRGANMTFGKNGTYINTGIPGTGMYNRQKIGGTSYYNILGKRIEGERPKGCSVLIWIFAILCIAIFVSTFFFDTVIGESITYSLIILLALLTLIGLIVVIVMLCQKPKPQPIQLDEPFKQDEVKPEVPIEAAAPKRLPQMPISKLVRITSKAHGLDPLFVEVAAYVSAVNDASIVTVQRAFEIGYVRAEKILKQLEEIEVIGAMQDGKRKVIYTKSEVLDYIEQMIEYTKSTKGDTPSQLEGQLSTKTHKIAPKKLKLDKLIGLASVKKEINTLTNFIEIQQKRAEQGLKVSPISYHCVFTGNPGTGKTTVARIVAGIYKDLGILSKGHLVETDRAGLVAEYVGQTAVKTNKIIDSALDGVLFIDEAYSLIQGGSNDFGKEAIATLLKRMEDDRDRLVIILAGYTKEIKDFIDSNPGLQSRFNRYIEFPDYSADELLQIFIKQVADYEYILADDAKQALANYFIQAVVNKDQNFGNARFVRNVFEKTLEKQANRLSLDDDLTKDELKTITLEDLPI